MPPLDADAAMDDAMDAMDVDAAPHRPPVPPLGSGFRAFEWVAELVLGGVRSVPGGVVHGLREELMKVGFTDAG